MLEPQPAPSAQLDSSVWIQNLQWLVHLDITASQERSVVHWVAFWIFKWKICQEYTCIVIKFSGVALNNFNKLMIHKVKVDFNFEATLKICCHYSMKLAIFLYFCTLDMHLYFIIQTTSCTQCPAGFSCSANNISPTPCPSGTYSTAGQTSCTACPAGQSCDTGSPTSCGTGYYSPSVSIY